jgi:rhomboid protease GluP
LLGITAIYVGMCWYGARFGDAGERWLLLRYGANFPPASLTTQPWRLVSSIFLHGHLPFHLHYLSNALALYVLGRFSEQMFGHTRQWLIFLLSGIAGAAASASVGHTFSVGASGAIFGLMGAIMVGLVGLRGLAPEPWRRRLFANLVVIIALQILMGYSVTVIDNAAHMGGLVGGAVVAWLVGRSRAEPQGGGRLKRTVIALLAVFLLLATVASLTQTIRRGVPFARYERAGLVLSAPMHWFSLPTESVAGLNQNVDAVFSLQDPLLEISPTLRQLLTRSVTNDADAFEQEARRQQADVLQELERMPEVDDVRLSGRRPSEVSADLLRSELLFEFEERQILQLVYFRRLEGLAQPRASGGGAAEPNAWQRSGPAGGPVVVSLLARVPVEAAPLYRPWLDRAVRSLAWAPRQRRRTVPGM